METHHDDHEQHRQHVDHDGDDIDDRGGHHRQRQRIRRAAAPGSLNSGSGVDTSSLVTSLVNAQFATKVAALQAKSDALTTKISDVSTLKGQISDFAGALESLVKGGTLVSQPASPTRRR